MTLVSGTAEDGLWELSCNIPNQVKNGDFVATPYATDLSDNNTNVNGGDSSPARAQFTISGGSDDWSGPSVMSLTTNQASCVPGDTFTVDLHLADPSGVQRAGVYFTRSGVQNDFCGQNMTLVSGSATDGTGRLTCTVPQTAPVGSYVGTPYALDDDVNC